MRILSGLLLALCCLLPSLPAETLAVPAGILYQGRLKEAGLHVTGARDVAVALYAAASGGDPLWSETHTDVPVIGGLFQLVLGSQQALSDTQLADGERWLEISIAGAAPLPRQPLTSSPYARVAGSVAGGSIERPALGSDLASELDTILSRLSALETQTASLNTQTAALETLTAELATETADLDTRTTTLETANLPIRTTALETKTNAINVLRVGGLPTLRFSGVNVQIVDGSGTTYGTANGLGNLIVGYNAQRVTPADRGGSHNLVVGDEHAYGASAKGGVVFGQHNTIVHDGSSVSGGRANVAEGYSSSVSGGLGNIAEGENASVSGGEGNRAEGSSACVSGGNNNIAEGDYSSVSGGGANTAIGIWASVSGGRANTAAGIFSVVVGGRTNRANGDHSTFLGGGDGMGTERVLGNVYSTGARAYTTIP